MEDIPIYDLIYKRYQIFITQNQPDLVGCWPIITGYNPKYGSFGEYTICVFFHTGHSLQVLSDIQVNSSILGVESIDQDNIEQVRTIIEKLYNTGNYDSVIIVKNNCENLEDEIKKMYFKHLIAMGVIKMKIFLSHTGIDKDRVREYQKCLGLIGFETWLDEDAMPAGTSLHRGILDGFNDSCAAVFFVTPSFKDEGYLETEVDYAIKQKMSKKDKFAIITLVFEENGTKGTVPGLLSPYVWKNPKTDLEGLSEILKALPIAPRNITYK